MSAQKLPPNATVLMSATAVDRALDRMAERIMVADVSQLALVGIRRRGVPLAQRLATRLQSAGHSPLVGELDITLYRDDLVEHAGGPLAHDSDIPFPVTGLRIVLVDDVFYTGRTALAALTAIADLGRPDRVELAVLIDRGYRELPLVTEIVGRKVTTERGEWVEVHVQEVDGYDAVLRYGTQPPKS